MRPSAPIDVPLAGPAWRPSPDLMRSLAQLLVNVTDRQRAGRLAHVADPAGGPDIAVVTDDSGFRREEK